MSGRGSHSSSAASELSAVGNTLPLARVRTAPTPPTATLATRRFEYVRAVRRRSAAIGQIGSPIENRLSPFVVRIDRAEGADELADLPGVSAACVAVMLSIVQYAVEGCGLRIEANNFSVHGDYLTSCRDGREVKDVDEVVHTISRPGNWKEAGSLQPVGCRRELRRNDQYGCAHRRV